MVCCRLVSSGSVKVQRNRLRLTAAATAADNGVYTCRARNAAASVISDPFIVNLPLGTLVDTHNFCSSFCDVVVRDWGTVSLNFVLSKNLIAGKCSSKNA